jgi:hypothetical protein
MTRQCSPVRSATSGDGGPPPKLSFFAALTDKTQRSGQAESLDVFHEYRIEIENLASAKYDAGKIKSDGLVVVDSPDLNPEQFQQGLA